ncbi:MAG: FAD-binding oxidoreductase [Clostridiales bacterium]|nr:FAD-binding oxidoreductase [Clostridiales bacterium]
MILRCCALNTADRREDNVERFDRIIIGAGLYGLYSALFSCRRGLNVLVLECDPAPFMRATYVNQARVHQGYHYPRSLSTALKSAHYFARFNKDFSFCINSGFTQIYATSSEYSWTDGKQFREFCAAAEIPCRELHPDKYFKNGLCDGVFETTEYSYDAMILKDYFLKELDKFGKTLRIEYNARIEGIAKESDSYVIRTAEGKSYGSGFVLNSTYAGTNQILEMAGLEKFRIKYELCEIILCTVNDALEKTGITVMDGPFFSIMPFGKTGYHSLTSVSYTPHTTSYSALPDFDCQKNSNGYCSYGHLGNCNDCPVRPSTAFPYMSGLARKYLLDDFRFEYKQSLFSMKPILKSSEIDDSRPTVIRVIDDGPVFASVLSGKINTIYDMDEVLEYDK